MQGEQSLERRLWRSRWHCERGSPALSRPRTEELNMVCGLVGRQIRRSGKSTGAPNDSRLRFEDIFLAFVWPDLYLPLLSDQFTALHLSYFLSYEYCRSSHLFGEHPRFYLTRYILKRG